MSGSACGASFELPLNGLVLVSIAAPEEKGVPCFLLGGTLDSPGPKQISLPLHRLGCSGGPSRDGFRRYAMAWLDSSQIPGSLLCIVGTVRALRFGLLGGSPRQRKKIRNALHCNVDLQTRALVVQFAGVSLRTETR